MTVALVGSATGVPTGTVILSRTGTSVGTGTFAAGSCTINTSTLPGGTDSVIATYSGDSNFTGSASTALSQTVTKNATTLAISSSPSPVPYGQAGTLTVTVTPQSPGGGTPTGTVTFYNGSTLLDSTNVVAGSPATATYNVTGLAVGANTINASYNGDKNFTNSNVAGSVKGGFALTTTTLTIAQPTTTYTPRRPHGSREDHLSRRGRTERDRDLLRRHGGPRASISHCGSCNIHSSARYARHPSHQARFTAVIAFSHPLSCRPTKSSRPSRRSLVSNSRRQRQVSARK